MIQARSRSSSNSGWWSSAASALTISPGSFLTCGLTNDTKLAFFAAKFDGSTQEIVIEASSTAPSCKVSGQRRIGKSEFDRVAGVYNDYVAGLLKRNILRDQYGQNTSYIISLIHHLI